MTDEVKKPKHYKMNEGDIECIDYIRQVLGPEGFIHYCHGNVIKYQHRYKYKGKPLQDLEKCYEYMGWMVDAMKGSEDNPELIEYADGTKAWYLNDKRHREDGPAIEYANGDKAWYLNGKLHREDGPAIEYADGDKYWYLNGTRFTEAKWKEKLCQS